MPSCRDATFPPPVSWNLHHSADPEVEIPAIRLVEQLSYSPSASWFYEFYPLEEVCRRHNRQTEKIELESLGDGETHHYLVSTIISYVDPALHDVVQLCNVEIVKIFRRAKKPPLR